MADDFSWVDGERLIRYGPTALEAAPALLAQRGFGDYALLTTDRALRSAPALEDGAGAVLRVPGGPVPEAAAAVRGSVHQRPLVALGGGRVIDAAKAIGGADGLPCAAVPTTLSGAEMTRVHRMPSGVDELQLVRPSLVISQPSLMASQPLPGLAASALNAVAHAVEALYTPFANPVAEAAALRSASLIFQGLEEDGAPDRPALALGATLAGYAVGSAGYAMMHVLCQTLVREAAVPHAEVYAAVLPHAVRFMAPRAPAAIDRLAGAVGGAGADELVDRLSALTARAGVSGLADLGVQEQMLPRVAAAALGRPELGNTPAPPDKNELLALLRDAL